MIIELKNEHGHKCLACEVPEVNNRLNGSINKETQAFFNRLNDSGQVQADYDFFNRKQVITLRGHGELNGGDWLLLNGHTGVVTKHTHEEIQAMQDPPEPDVYFVPKEQLEAFRKRHAQAIHIASKAYDSITYTLNCCGVRPDKIETEEGERFTCPACGNTAQYGKDLNDATRAWNAHVAPVSEWALVELMQIVEGAKVAQPLIVEAEIEGGSDQWEES